MLAILWSRSGCVAGLRLCTIGATLLRLHGDYVLCVPMVGGLVGSVKLTSWGGIFIAPVLQGGISQSQ